MRTSGTRGPLSSLSHNSGVSSAVVGGDTLLDGGDTLRLNRAVELGLPLLKSFWIRFPQSVYCYPQVPIEYGPFRIVRVAPVLSHVHGSVVAELLGDQAFQPGQDGHVLGEVLFTDLQPLQVPFPVLCLEKKGTQVLPVGLLAYSDTPASLLDTG